MRTRKTKIQRKCPYCSTVNTFSIPISRITDDKIWRHCEKCGAEFHKTFKKEYWHPMRKKQTQRNKCEVIGCERIARKGLHICRQHIKKSRNPKPKD